ncbi:hypothetical protein E2C01_054024 [Portunus trituberculatus]|uniref:Uncharacterized protein n=1 Tax=Portunus trituberculatus TaxID=210409 RepID=A0A5B7GI73_PORTR|nr:hypothetical protein [Portunus trituberculatus]
MCHHYHHHHHHHHHHHYNSHITATSPLSAALLKPPSSIPASATTTKYDRWPSIIAPCFPRALPSTLLYHSCCSDPPLTSTLTTFPTPHISHTEITDTASTPWPHNSQLVPCRSLDNLPFPLLPLPSPGNTPALSPQRPRLSPAPAHTQSGSALLRCRPLPHDKMAALTPLMPDPGQWLFLDSLCSLFLSLPPLPTPCLPLALAVSCASSLFASFLRFLITEKVGVGEAVFADFPSLLGGVAGTSVQYTRSD